MKGSNWKSRIRYCFDNIMSKGTISLIGILFAITLAVVVISGVIVALLNLTAEGLSIGDATWVSLMHAIDAGTLTADSGGFWFMLIMTLVTICGLFITSILIGIINTGISDKMESLRKGKSLILEKDHTVILGFNENTLNIIGELILANENQKRAVVVVMAEEDKTVMEDLIHQRFPSTGSTHVICRSGSIDSFSDLGICSIQTCRSVIINVEQDFLTIKAILACVSLLNKSSNRDAYVTAMIHDEENMDAARIAGAGRAEILYFQKTIARIMAHSSRESGISKVFTTLLSYQGNEIYVEHIPGVAGYTMEDINLFFPISTVIGIVRDGTPMVNPPRDTVIADSDSLILVAEDDGLSVPALAPAEIDRARFAQPRDIPTEPQHLLILGCSPLLPQILLEEDEYAAPGSVVIVAAEKERMDGEFLPDPAMLKNIKVNLQVCNIFSKSKLEKLLEDAPDNVLILTDTDSDSEEADAKTLLLLLHLRNISRASGVEFTVTSEMRSTRNRELAEVTKVNDFVISSNITAMMMTQISQTREQHAILDDLLDEEGSEIYMKPASRYVNPGEETDFYTVNASAARYGEVVIGYKRFRKNERAEIVVNPPKADRITFRPEDTLIVIAED